MLMKYVLCVLLLMESRFSNSLEDNRKNNLEIVEEKVDAMAKNFDCVSRMTDTENEGTKKFYGDENSCCHVDYSYSIPVIICFNVETLHGDIDLKKAYLILINSAVKFQAQTIQELNGLSIQRGSNITIGEGSLEVHCWNPEKFRNKTSLKIRSLEVMSSWLQYTIPLSLPNLTNLTVIDSSVSANILDLSWTMDSHYLEIVSVINSSVNIKPCKVSCVSRSHKEFLMPRSLREVSFNGTEFRCLYIATAETQWYLKLRSRMKDQNIKCTAEMAEFGRSSYFFISNVAEAFQSIKKDCPEQCCCWSARMNHTNKIFEYTVEVDCSGRHLTTIPTLPKYVSSLDISNNQIESLESITTDKHSYSKLHILRADNNRLRSIKDLCESHISRHFTLLNISSNQIPIDKSLMDFVKTRQTTDVYGSGIWIANNTKDQCTCEMAKTIRPWLWAHSPTIKDHRQIYCLNNTKFVKLLFLYEESICPQTEPINLDSIFTYMIIVESILIALSLSKLLWDFWVFKRTSQLPWVAMKLF